MLFAPGCQSPPETQLHKFSGVAMGTTYSVAIVAPALPVEKQALRQALEALLEQTDREMSTYRADSELMRLNQAASDNWNPVSQPLLRVLQAAQETSRLSAGAFDITIGPLVNLWGFGPVEKRAAAPTEGEIDGALERVGYQKLQLDARAGTVKKAPGLFIDLSAIAKGYGVDRIALYLQELGLDNYLVEIGGELRARGVNGDNVPWRVGIEKPLAERRAVHRLIELRDTAMATSGNYRNFFEQDGVRYSHAIDPRAGRPTTRRLLSVTVLHPAAMRADAWATALLLAGPEQGFALAEKHGLAAYFLIDATASATEQSPGENGGGAWREKFTANFKPAFVAP